MRKEVAVKEKTEVTTQTDPVDFLKAYVRETSGKTWVGDLLKFVKGDFKAGQDNDDVELGTRFVAMVPGMVNGWIKWSERRPVAHEMGIVMEGFQSPDRKDLDDNDKTLWEEDGRDPWQRASYIVMVAMDTRQIFTFATQSKGGRSALGELVLQFSKHYKMSPTQVPVVELGASKYKHSNPSFGFVHVPTFKVIGWEEQEPFMALLTGAEDQEEEETPRTAVTIKKKVAEKPKAKGKAGNSKRPVRFA